MRAYLKTWQNRVPSRILMTADTVGGVWTFALELCEALRQGLVPKESPQITLATFGGKPSASQWVEAARIPELRLFASEFKLEWMKDPWEDVIASGQWLMELADTFTPDIVHLNTFAHGTLPWRCPVVLTAHSCVASWWKAVKGTKLPAEWAAYTDLVRGSLRSADVVTAPSNELLEEIRLLYGLADDPARVFAIPNGRQERRFRENEKEEFILSAGRLWDEGKGIDTLISASPGLPWPVYLAGEQQNSGNTVPTSTNCRLLGRLSAEHLAIYYSRAAIYVLPARYEPFGLSILEAALSGCALVLGDIPSLREIWGDTALFVKPGHVAGLSRALGELTANASMRQSLAQASFDRARTFTPARMAAGYSTAYARAAALREGSVACAS